MLALQGFAGTVANVLLEIVLLYFICLHLQKLLDKLRHNYRVEIYNKAHVDDSELSEGVSDDCLQSGVQVVIWAARETSAPPPPSFCSDCVLGLREVGIRLDCKASDVRYESPSEPVLEALLNS